jgi:hypothetical protein
MIDVYVNPPMTKRYPTITAPEDEKYPLLTGIKDGPPVGTVARCAWLEQGARDCLETVKAKLGDQNGDDLIPAVCDLMIVVGDLVQARKARNKQL